MSMLCMALHATDSTGNMRTCVHAQAVMHEHARAPVGHAVVGIGSTDADTNCRCASACMGMHCQAGPGGRASERARGGGREREGESSVQVM